MSQAVLHKHSLRGNDDMEIPSKEHIIGNTRIIIHSPLVAMTEDERLEWFEREMENGNPILERIGRAVNACYHKD